LKSFKIGILRVLTTDNKEVLNSHQNILAEYFPEFEIETKCIPNQYNGLYNQEAHVKALPDIIRMAKEWEKDIDGLIISCSDDPGLEFLRKELTIPVVGAGISVSCLIMLYGLKAGIIGIEEVPPSSITNILGDSSFEYIVPEGIINTSDLLTKKGKRAIVDSAEKLKNMGAEIIVFACTGLSTADAAHLISHIGLPVIDGVIAEGIAMKSLLINKNFNKNNYIFK
jgi:Asp/Glu/hydantoin racemase